MSVRGVKTGPNPAKGRRPRDKLELQAALNPDKPVMPYPDDLPEDQKKVWLNTVNTKSADYWNKADVPLLTVYCRCVADIARLTDELEEEGEVVMNARGTPVANPKVTIRSLAEGRLMTLCTKLRLQPSSRVKVEVEALGMVRKRGAQAAASHMDADPLLAGSFANDPPDYGAMM